MQDSMLNDAYKTANTSAQAYSNLIKADMNTEMNMVRALAQSATYTKADLTEDQKLDVIKRILYNIVKDNPQINSIAASYELSYLDPNWTKTFGRVRYTYFRQQNDNIEWVIDTLNTNGDKIGSNYHTIKITKNEFVADPYWFSYTNSENDKVLVTTFDVPIIYNDKYAGLVGVDLELDRFQTIIDSIKPMEKGFATLIAFTGEIIAHPNKDFVGDTLHNVYTLATQKHNIVERIQKGESISFIEKDPHKNKEYYYSIEPIRVGASTKPWALAIAVPMDVLTEEVDKAFRNSLFVGIVGLILIFILVWVIAKNITKPLVKTTGIIKDLAIGDINVSKKIYFKYKDEIGDISTSVNTLIDGLNNTANIAKEIGEGNLTTEFKVLSEKDILGNALLDMRSSLYKASQEELERKKEDEKRNWATEGHALLGDVLRQNNDKIEVLSFQILKNIIKYLKINQGGIFIVNDDSKNEHFLELKACYAFDRKKHLNKRIEIGEGLVGACFQEKQTIYITDVPNTYIEITSGLGNESPKSILIVPLKLNDEVYGVIELASFKDFQQYEIDFVQKISESIASTISTVKINERTATLLEQSQLQAEQMRAQEEEMRQNMEELSATQEEMLRKSMEAESKIETLEEENQKLKNKIQIMLEKYNIEDFEA